MALFQRLNRTDPERVFIVVQNNIGSASTRDGVAQWELASASIDGVKARSPATGNLHAVAGVWDAATANGEYGLIQVYGYRSTSIVFQTDTSIDTGVVLVPVAGQVYLASVATTFASNTTVTIQPVIAVLGESVATSTASATISKKVFLRVM